jgi:hypothetical protein
MKTNMIIGGAAVVFVLGGAVGWYGSSHASSSKQLAARGDFAAMRQGGGGNGGNMVAGEILSKDATGMTVKLMNGGSRIVLLSDSTEITKMASGSAADLKTGVTVTVRGTQNPDGSVTAQQVQLRPAMVTPPAAR